MAAPSGIIPEELMTPGAKDKVIAFLRAAPYEADLKRALLRGWSQWVGLTLSQEDYLTVSRTGIDISRPPQRS